MLIPLQPFHLLFMFPICYLFVCKFEVIFGKSLLISSLFFFTIAIVSSLSKSIKLVTFSCVSFTFLFNLSTVVSNKKLLFAQYIKLETNHLSIIIVPNHSLFQNFGEIFENKIYFLFQEIWNYFKQTIRFQRRFINLGLYFRTDNMNIL